MENMSQPHTQLPHVPQNTQPHSGTITRLTPYPVISSVSDSTHRNFVQSTITGKAAEGLASVEYVFDQSRSDDVCMPSGDAVWELHCSESRNQNERKRMKMVEDAVRWEIEGRKRQKAQAQVQAQADAAGVLGAEGVNGMS